MTEQEIVEMARAAGWDVDNLDLNSKMTEEMELIAVYLRGYMEGRKRARIDACTAINSICHDRYDREALVKVLMQRDPD